MDITEGMKHIVTTDHVVLVVICTAIVIEQSGSVIKLGVAFAYYSIYFFVMSLHSSYN